MRQVITLQVSFVKGTLRLTYATAVGAMLLDASTVRHLELLRDLRTGDRRASLFGVLCSCKTAAGTRLLRSSLIQARHHHHHRQQQQQQRRQQQQHNTGADRATRVSQLVPFLLIRDVCVQKRVLSAERTDAPTNTDADMGADAGAASAEASSEQLTSPLTVSQPAARRVRPPSRGPSAASRGLSPALGDLGNLGAEHNRKRQAVDACHVDDGEIGEIGVEASDGLDELRWETPAADAAATAAAPRTVSDDAVPAAATTDGTATATSTARPARPELGVELADAAEASILLTSPRGAEIAPPADGNAAPDADDVDGSSGEAVGGGVARAHAQDADDDALDARVDAVGSAVAEMLLALSSGDVPDPAVE